MPLQLQQSKPQDSSLGVRKIGPNSVQSFTFSLFRHPTEKTLAENSVKKEYSPRKKFAAAKRAMGDAHCDDQESSRDLQKRLKLSKQKFYDAIRAMREGREVGHNGRPSYLLPPEKVQFWSWVDKGRAHTFWISLFPTKFPNSLFGAKFWIQMQPNCLIVALCVLNDSY